MLAHRQLIIPSKQGELQVPATKSFKEIPDFAVTMTTFGLFEVTHTPSGKSVVSGFERMVNALIAMAELQLGLNELQIDSGGDPECFRASILESNIKAKALGDLTLSEWISIGRKVGNFSGEFPWESPNDGPHAKFESLLKKLISDGADISPTPDAK